MSSENRTHLNGKNILIVFLFFLAVLWNCLEAFYRYEMLWDYMYLISGTFQMLAGRGIGLAKVSAADLSQVFVEKQLWWPPGFNLMVGAMSEVTKDMLMAIMIYNWSAIFVSFLSVFAVLKLCGPALNEGEKLGIAFFLTFVQGPIGMGFETDRMSLAFLLAAVALAVWAIKKNRLGFFSGAACGFLVGAAALTRLAYFGVLPALPLAWIYLFYRLKEQRRAIVWSTLGYGLMALGMLGIYYWWREYRPFVLTPSMYQRGFHPQNLLHTHPFAIEALGFSNWWRAVTGSYFALWTYQRSTNETAQHLVRFGWPITIFILAIYGRTLRDIFSRSRQTDSSTEDAFRFFNAVGLAIIAGTVGLLAWLSLTTPEGAYPPLQGWTYISDGRYFMPTIIFLEFCLLHFLFRKTVGSKVLAGARVGVALLILLGVGGFFHRNVRLAQAFHEYEYGRDILDFAQDKGAVSRLLRDYPAPFPKVYVDSKNQTDDLEPFLASLVGIPWVLVKESETIKTSQPVSVILAIRDDDRPTAAYFEELRARNNSRLIGNSSTARFYFFNLYPETSAES